jgi:hypothetical protein
VFVALAAGFVAAGALLAVAFEDGAAVFEVEAAVLVAAGFFSGAFFSGAFFSGTFAAGAAFWVAFAGAALFAVAALAAGLVVAVALAAAGFEAVCLPVALDDLTAFSGFTDLAALVVVAGFAPLFAAPVVFCTVVFCTVVFCAVFLAVVRPGAGRVAAFDAPALAAADLGPVAREGLTGAPSGACSGP